MNILIVGNVLKDVYLSLDERLNEFELDDKKTPWLNLGFDGSSHQFFHRNSVLGGATVAFEVFNNFGLSTGIINSSLEYHDGDIAVKKPVKEYRYILRCNEGVSYFTASRREKTVWEEPLEKVDWIFVDRSANLSMDSLQKLKIFLKNNQATKLAVYIGKDLKMTDIEILKLADLVFTENKEQNWSKFEKPVFIIGDNEIKISTISQSWDLPREDLLTHLTAHSIIAATILASLLNGKSIREALTLAKTNVENSTLTNTLTFRKLEELSK